MNIFISASPWMLPPFGTAWRISLRPTREGKGERSGEGFLKDFRRIFKKNLACKRNFVTLQTQQHMVLVVQLVRALDCGSSCHGFESHRVPQEAEPKRPGLFYCLDSDGKESPLRGMPVSCLISSITNQDCTEPRLSIPPSTFIRNSW